MPNPPTILITGLAGFIASNAAEGLRSAGWRVFGMDNFSNFYDRRWKEMNLQCIGAGDKDSNIEFEQADITDATAVRRIMEKVKPDAILHLAAMAGVRPSIEQPAYYAKVNVEGTANVLQAAVDNRVGRFLFASSSSIYGNRPVPPVSPPAESLTTPGIRFSNAMSKVDASPASEDTGGTAFSETDPVTEPISPYAATKRACELMCYSFWHLYKMPIFCLRFFTVYGPRQRPDLAIQKFARLIDAGKPIPMFGDGSTSRDYTFVGDIVQGILAALDKCDRYRIYNLGGSDPITLKDLIAAIELAVGKKAIIDQKLAQPGDVERTFASLARSTAELGYKPRTPLAEGLKQFVKWMREYGEKYPYSSEQNWRP